MTEQTLVFGAEQHLVATLTPAARSFAQAPSIVAVLTNSGVIPRSGPHRMNVHLARRFAALGIPSIRFDMSGLGDSRRAGGNLPALQQWVVDTRAAMDVAQARFGCDRFFMIGFCSGAEVAHLVALEDPRMRAALLWDLYAYPTLQSELHTLAYRVRRAGPRKLLQKLVHKARLPWSSRPADAESTDTKPPVVSLVPPKQEFARRLQVLVDSGVELMVAYSGGEPVWFNHRGQFRGMFGNQPFFHKLAFEFLEVSDHLITRREAQSAFLRMVEGWVTGRVQVSAQIQTQAQAQVQALARPA